MYIYYHIYTKPCTKSPVAPHPYHRTSTDRETVGNGGTEAWTADKAQNFSSLARIYAR